MGRCAPAWMPVNSTSRTEPTAETREANGSFLARAKSTRAAMILAPGSSLMMKRRPVLHSRYQSLSMVYSFAARRTAVSTRAAMA